MPACSAVDRTAQGLGFVAMLLVHALKRAGRVRTTRGHAAVVEALDDSGRDFYLKYGVSELLDDPLHLFCPSGNFVNSNY